MARDKKSKGRNPYIDPEDIKNAQVVVCKKEKVTLRRMVRQ